MEQEATETFSDLKKLCSKTEFGALGESSVGFNLGFDNASTRKLEFWGLMSEVIRICFYPMSDLRSFFYTN